MDRFARALYNRSDMTTERTFAIIKPDAVRANNTGRILSRIEEAGFTVRGTVSALRNRTSPCFSRSRASWSSISAPLLRLTT